MTAIKAVVGAALFVYTVLYILQVVFSSLYADLLSPSEVWRVMNYVTAVGIIIAAGVAYAHKRRLRPETPAGQTIGALAAFYTTLALGIWFFTVWFRLLTLGEGESVSEADNVIWHSDFRDEPVRPGDHRGVALEVGIARQGGCAGRLTAHLTKLTRVITAWAAMSSSAGPNRSSSYTPAM